MPLSKDTHQVVFSVSAASGFEIRAVSKLARRLIPAGALRVVLSINQDPEIF
jgi:hypothetical protein